jgi:hypothetical protein
MCIKPFRRSVDQVMSQPQYDAQRRAFWIMNTARRTVARLR